MSVARWLLVLKFSFSFVRMILKRMKIGFVFAVLLILALPCDLFACPNCKDGLHSTNLATAYGSSILLLMAMPLLILGVWSFVIAKVSNRVILNSNQSTDSVESNQIERQVVASSKQAE